MKVFSILIVLILLSVPAVTGAETRPIEATTKIDLPVDAVTIYPDGLVAVRHTGEMDVTKGVHEYVVDVPSSASIDSVLFLGTNSTLERIVYDNLPTYTLEFLSSGSQRFSLSYLMYDAGTWLPSYSLHLLDDTMVISANAIVGNDFDQDMLDVRLKLVSGPPQRLFDDYDNYAIPELAMAYEEGPAEPKRAPDYVPSAGGARGEVETLYVFEIGERTDLETGKVIGLPLFEKEVPVDKLFTWDAYDDEEGPVMEVIRANNTMDNPWPEGDAFLYDQGDYVATVEVDYTPTGSNASLVVGPSAGLEVSKKLSDYNLTEEIRQIKSDDNATHAVKVTTENWTYRLETKSLLDEVATVEIEDYKPMEAELVMASPSPSETTATMLKWVLDLEPRETTKVEYTYRIVETQPLNKS